MLNLGVIFNIFLHSWWDFEYTDCIPLKKDKISEKKVSRVWHQSPTRDLRNMEYPFITISLSSTLSWSGSTY